MNELKKEFFMSQIKIIRDIKETEKTKISLVYYEGTQSTCILRVCKNRDLSEVCKKLMEIKHPNIVVTYDYIYAEGNTYIIEEYISGRSLEEIIEENGKLTEDDTVRIITKVCEGLELLHSLESPLVHNDINTSNIMIRDDGSVKLFDFDISRFYRSGASKNTVLFGTEEYAAPEHFGYGQSEPRTDIYSIGVTMHRMLTGESLDNEHQSIYNGSLKKIVSKCIQIAPQKRYATVLLLKRDLNKNRKKTVMLIKCIAIAALIAIVLVGGVAVGRNISVDGEVTDFNNASNDYLGYISNETQKDGEEIETTISQVEIEGAIGEVAGTTTENSTENVTEDITNDTIENITEETSTHIHRYIQKTVEATCTEKGYVEYTCSCGEQYISETPIKEHEYIANIINATCTEDGYTIHTCACGDSYIDNVVEGKHHWYAATCDKAKECSRCGIKDGEALGHNYERYVCTVCEIVDKEGYARAVNPEFCLKRGEYYTQVLTSKALDSMTITQILFENGSNKVKFVRSNYATEPIEGAGEEYLKPYIYNGITYYKQWEHIHNEYTYEIMGSEDIDVNDKDGFMLYSFKFTIEGWMLNLFDSVSTQEDVNRYKYAIGFQFD